MLSLEQTEHVQPLVAQHSTTWTLGPDSRRSCHDQETEWRLDLARNTLFERISIYLRHFIIHTGTVKVIDSLINQASRLAIWWIKFSLSQSSTNLWRIHWNTSASPGLGPESANCQKVWNTVNDWHSGVNKMRCPRRRPRGNLKVWNLISMIDIQASVNKTRCRRRRWTRAWRTPNQSATRQCCWKNGRPRETSLLQKWRYSLSCIPSVGGSINHWHRL